MSKKLIPVLVVTMALALLGLIAVQAFWMREAINMKAEEFNRGVSEALKSTNYALEVREASRLLANSLDQKLLVRQIDSLAGPVIYTYDTIESIVAAKEVPKKPIRSTGFSFSTLPQPPIAGVAAFGRNDADCLIVIREKGNPIGHFPGQLFTPTHPQLETVYSQEALRQFQQARQFYQISFDFDSMMTLWADSGHFNLSGDRLFYFNSSEGQRQLKGSKNAQVIISSSDSSLARAQVRYRSAPNNPLPRIKPQAATPEVKRQIVQKKLRIDSLLNKVAFDFISPKQPIEKRISEHEFDSILRANLLQQGITADFRFQVVREQADGIQLIYGDEIFSPVYHEARLFPNDMFNLNERLLLYFPNPSSFLLGNLLGMLLVSFALILVLVVIFFVAISVLLRQKKLSDMKSDFINNMTHEFKTPLATINLAADALANPKVQHDNELSAKYLGIIKTENRRMNTHVEQVLQTAQLDRQELTLNLQRIDLRYLLEHAIALMEMQYENRQAKLSLHCNHESCFINGDEAHLLNVFTNLLDNALKYAKTNPEVEVSGIVSGQKAVIRVKDNGIGMSRDTRQHIFEKFYRLPTGNVHNIKGFGLGLSYVKAIIEAHKGSIQVESELDVGSTFIVTLPITQ